MMLITGLNSGAFIAQLLRTCSGEGNRAGTGDKCPLAPLGKGGVEIYKDGWLFWFPARPG